MDWFVYILRCRDGTLYTGATNDVGRRLLQHTAGVAAAYTRGRGPLELLYAEAVGAKGEALRREAALKRLTRRAKLELVARGRT